MSASLYQHWTKISNPTSLVVSVRWPEKRFSHAATCVSGPLLVIMGGMATWKEMTGDCWIYDLTAMLWKKVHVLMYFKCGSEIDLDITFFSYPSLTQ